MDKDRLSGNANTVFGQAESAIGKAASDAEGMAREGKGAFQSALGQAKDTARDIGRSASKAADAAFDTGSSMVRNSGSAIADNIQSNPGRSLVAAGIIGFALGVIIAKGSQPPRRRRVWERYY